VSARAVLDVSHLPTLRNDSRANLWWGNAWMLVIESVMFALVVTTYFYLRMNQAEWPPPGANIPDLALPSVNLAVMVAMAGVAFWLDRAAVAMDRWATIARSLVLIALAVAHLVIRVIVWRQLDFDWAAHAYGSIVWGILALHTTHLLTGTLETSAMTFAMSRQIHEKDFLDVRCTVAYWYFIVGWWVVLWLVLYVSPHVVHP
jgi:cytochrome c oxidase subunit 3